jgi:hypothetical protein
MTRESGWWFWLTVLAIFVLGALGIWQPFGSFQLRRPYDDLVRQLGEALIIASIVATTVDFYSKRRMLREVVRDVFQYIAGHPLPPQLQTRIKNLVCTHLIRRDMPIRYDFAYAGDRVLLTTETEFKLENLFSSWLPFQQTLEFEAHDSPRVLSMRCVSSEKNASYDIRASEQKPNVASADESDPGMFVAKGKKINIRPNANNAAISYVVTSKYQCSFSIDSSDVFSFLMPTIGTTVQATSPSDLDVSISDYVAKGGAGQWTFDVAFTRSEHFRIRWHRKTAQPS